MRLAQSAVVNEEVKVLESWNIELPLSPNLNLGMFACLGPAVWEEQKQTETNEEASPELRRKRSR